MNKIPGQLMEYYDNFQSELFDYAKEVETIDAVLKRNHVKTVVDIGCGTGMHLIGLASIGYVCFGIDNSMEMITKARKRAKAALVNTNIIKADARISSSVMRYHGYFDASLWIRNTTSSVADIKLVLKTQYDLLKNRGVLIFDLLQPDENASNAGEDEIFDMDVITEKGMCVVRLNNFKIRSSEVDYQSVYFIQLQTGARLVPNKVVLPLINKDGIKKILSSQGFKYESSIYDYIGIPKTKSVMILARKNK